MNPHTELHLLLIEDNPGDARLIREILIGSADEKIDLEQKDTLAGGLAFIQVNVFDAILLDLSLPDSSGVETLRAIRKQSAHIPIIVLTGYNDRDLGVQAVQSGAQDYLVKGETNGDTLLRAIHYSIERSRIEERLRHSEEEYRSLIEDVFRNSDIAILILDVNFRIVWLNEATEMYFGIPRQELIGQDKREILDSKIKCIFDDPDGYAQRIRASYVSNDFSERFECHVLPNEHRRERWLEHSSQPIHSGIYAGGRIQHYMDITARKRIEIAESEQRKFAEALRDTLALLTSTLDLDEVFTRILENLGLAVPHDAANIMMLEDGVVRVVRSRSVMPDKRKTDEMYEVGQLSAVSQMLVSGQPLAVSTSHPDFPNLLFTPSDGRTYIGAPILLQDQPIGFINVFSFAGNAFQEKDVDRLTAFAEQAAIAIQNAKLFQQSQALAALEERQRLARDLHDSVTQTLFSATVIAESLIRSWETNKERVETLLPKLHQLTTGALAEMRVLLLELRPASLVRVPFSDLLSQLVRSLQSHKLIDVEMEIDALPELSPAVKIAFYRIAQEALNNVVKHSMATQLSIQVRFDHQQLKMVIRDDGKGFDVTATVPTSLGTNIMRERAAEIGADLTIVSAPQAGTEITVTHSLTS